MKKKTPRYSINKGSSPLIANSSNKGKGYKSFLDPIPHNILCIMLFKSVLKKKNNLIPAGTQNMSKPVDLSSLFRTLLIY